MNKWLNQFLEKPDISDNTDRFDSNVNMSGLSGRPQRVLDKNLGNMPETRTDSTDRFNSDANMSVLSAPPYDLLGRRVPYSLDGDSLKYAFEERRAIAEVDGHQTPLRAQRMAYVGVLSAKVCDTERKVR